ncbi:MAG TPA: ROK family protein [Flavilitoribacter sp.]|nr:ROK family protein [Flavilitoribacter sp.]HMQ87659.1 ROK family protein [Flavilitoribacter sp.]
MSKPVFGIDLGGTKIEGVVLPDSDSIEPIARIRVPTEKEKGAEHIANQIVKLVRLLEEESGIKAEKIGIGTPGAIDPPTGLMKNSNTTCLNGRPFRDELEAALNLPVIMANDANCFAVAEARLGVIRKEMPNARVVFGVIMGTGVGGGIVIDGKVINGAQGIAGEWGHSYLDDSGGACYCGNTGCVETIISGPALERYYQSLTGSKIVMKEILERYKAWNDPAAIQTIERLIHFFGKATANLINILDPDAIVLGGGLGNIDLLYTEGREAVKKFVFNPRLDTPFFRPVLGDSAGVFGAAMLVA